ncbi:hypothetical protein NBRC116597_27450 [Phaeobacter sp. NW0010-22]
MSFTSGFTSKSAGHVCLSQAVDVVFERLGPDLTKVTYFAELPKVLAAAIVDVRYGG